VKPETVANTDPEFERALLGVLLADNRAFDQIGQLEPDDLSAGYAWCCRPPRGLACGQGSCGHDRARYRGGARWTVLENDWTGPIIVPWEPFPERRRPMRFPTTGKLRRRQNLPPTG
jgi:hypothetical protein